MEPELSLAWKLAIAAALPLGVLIGFVVDKLLALLDKQRKR